MFLRVQIRGPGGELGSKDDAAHLLRPCGQGQGHLQLSVNIPPVLPNASKSSELIGPRDVEKASRDLSAGLGGISILAGL